MNTPTVVILAAGIGSRMGKQAGKLHKALLSINHKPVLSHILNQFPPSLPVVVAVGHLASQVKDYLSLAHPERHFTFVDVPGYDQKGSGPGTSLCFCKPHIPGPFYITTVDTLILNPLPPINRNWVGVAPINNPERFCTVSVDDKSKIKAFADKQQGTPNRLAFIGLAGIYQTNDFWDALESDSKLIAGEKQLSNGLQGLLKSGLYAETMNWLDTGSTENLDMARKQLEKGAFDFSKDSEQTYIIENRAIKWFYNQDTAKARVSRAQNLSPHVPKIIGSKDHFFMYDLVAGKTVYHSLSNFNPDVFFSWLQNSFWSNESSPKNFNEQKMKEAAMRFYYDKTLRRFQSALEKTGVKDQKRQINGMDVPAVSDLLKEIDWDSMASHCIPSRFHGDLQFDNMIATENPEQPFVLIDWREDFGGLSYGDRYYDLAKLNGGFSLNYADVKAGRNLPFKTSENRSEITISPVTDECLIKIKQAFDLFCKKYKYDLRRIEMITSLIYLNMAPMHGDPFDIFLIYFGQWKLAQALQMKTK